MKGRRAPILALLLALLRGKRPRKKQNRLP